MIKLSIIVAAYNVEKYIDDCLLSVLKQINESEVQLIVVNDGSTDNTLERIKEIKHANNFIMLINKENGGLSDARNAGLKYVEGEYVTFLDGDDVWLDNYYESVVSQLHTYDLIEFDAVRFKSFDDCDLENNYVHIVNKNGIKEASYSELKYTFKNSQWFVWARIYKREIFLDIEFPYRKRFEDMATTPLAYFKSQSIFSIKKPLIGYRTNEFSITRNPTKRDIDDIFYAMQSVSKRVENKYHQKLWSLSCVRSASLIKYINNTLFGYFNSFDFARDIFKFIKNNISLSILNSYNRTALLNLYFPKLTSYFSYLKFIYSEKHKIK